MDKRRTDGVIGVDKGAAIPRFSQGVVAEAAQRPDLRAVIGAIDAGRDVATLRRAINFIFDLIQVSVIDSKFLVF